MRRIINNAPKAALSTPSEAPEPGSPIANLQKAARWAKDEGDMTQAEKFAQAARELGADQDKEAFKGVMREVATHKPSAMRARKAERRKREKCQ